MRRARSHRSRHRSSFARYHEKNPTTESYVIAGIGLAVVAGVGYWLYSQSQASAVPAVSGTPVFAAGQPANVAPSQASAAEIAANAASINAANANRAAQDASSSSAVLSTFTGSEAG